MKIVTKNQLARKIADKMLSEDKHSQQLGIEIVTAEVGYSVCKMTLTDIHLNGHGTCHGGAIFSLADTTFAHICNAHNQIAVAHMCNIAYWKPGLHGDVLYAVARENGIYGRSGSYTISVRKNTEDGEVIAEFTGFSRALKGQTHFS